MTVDEELVEIANKLKETASVAKAGIMAEDYIRLHIVQGKLEPISSVTQQFRGGKNGKPLQDTGSLRDSITSELISENTVSVGTNKIYAPLQNNGGTITAKKEWLFIPGPRMRYYQRKFGAKPKDVLAGLRSEDFYVYRMGRTIVYRKKSKQAKPHVAYYLKKSVVIPKREFFFLTEDEKSTILRECYKL